VEVNHFSRGFQSAAAFCICQSTTRKNIDEGGKDKVERRAKIV